MKKRGVIEFTAMPCFICLALCYSLLFFSIYWTSHLAQHHHTIECIYALLSVDGGPLQCKRVLCFLGWIAHLTRCTELSQRYCCSGLLPFLVCRAVFKILPCCDFVSLMLRLKVCHATLWILPCCVFISSMLRLKVCHATISFLPCNALNFSMLL